MMEGGKNMEPFFSQLETRIEEASSLVCVGLDPHPRDLPAPTGQAALDFCLRLIEETHDLAAAYKPNAAFFEALGAEGFEALQQVIASIPEGIPVILDIKRGDIASTAQAYARAAYDYFKADAVTLNPYLGRDAVSPFLDDPSRGAFILCKTSNPGAADLQDLPLDYLPASQRTDDPGGPLYLRVAQLVQQWNADHNLGLVVGATQVESLASVRDAAPDLWFLAPGIGAQGGDLASALSAGLRQDGQGMIIPVSRGISRAENPRKAALKLRDSINSCREELLAKRSFPGRTKDIKEYSPEVKEIAWELLEAGCIKFGEFTLKSGARSPIYIDLRRLIGFPRLLNKISFAYLQILEGLSFDHLAGLPYAALPIAAAISLQAEQSMIYPRKEAKDYGTKAVVEGCFQEGDTAVVIDDLITTGGSKIEGIEKLKSQGLRVRDVVVLIDRSRQAADQLAQHGYRLHAVLNLSQLVDYYVEEGWIDPDQAAAVRRFLEQDA